MNITDKAVAVHFLAKRLPYSRRIVLSDSSLGPSELRIPSDIETTLQEKGSKPSGIWYSFGGAWAEFLWDNELQWSYNRLEAVTHIYALRLNYSCIYRIKTAKQFEEFESRFANKSRTQINWLKIAQDWAGIEIRLIPEKAYGDPPWYEHWDVSSGCVWHRAAVRSIKVLHKWEARWSKVV